MKKIFSTNSRRSCKDKYDSNQEISLDLLLIQKQDLESKVQIVFDEVNVNIYHLAEK